MKPTRLFTADEGKKSVGLSGPDAIEKDIDVINTMFDPLKTHEDDSEGGIQEENLGTNLAKKVNDALDYSTDAVETLIPDLESNKADREEIYTKTELNNGQLDNRYYTETELNTGVLDGRYYTETELNNNQLGSLYYTKSQLSPFLAGGSVPIYTDKYTIVNSDNEDGTFTYSYKGANVIGNIINEDTQVFTIEGNTYPHGNDSLLVYVDGVPFTSIEGNEVLELSNTTFGLKPIQSSDMVITIKYVNATGIIAVDNVIQQLEDVTQQSLDTIAEIDNVREEMLDKADLDITGNVPVEQLGNTEYMKEWYGRGVISYEPKDIFTRDRLLVETDVLAKSEINFYDWVDTPYVVSSSGSVQNVTIPELFLETSYKNSLITHFNFATNGGGYRTIYGNSTSTSPAIFTLCSIKPIDLTNIKEISFYGSVYRSSDSHIDYVYFGVSSNNTSTAPTAFTEVTVSNAKYTVNVESLTGLYYIKFYFRTTNVDASKQIGATIHRDFIITPIANPTLNFNKTITLADNALEETLKLPTATLPTRALDWYSLNALVDTPPNTSVEYDLYDNHNVLLKGDVQNGETFRDFTNPIIVPKVTLKRNSLADPKPTWERLTLGYRGAQTFEGMWNKIDEIILTQNTTQIDIQKPDDCEELKIVCNILASGTGNLNIKFNNNTSTNSYVYHQTQGTASTSYVGSTGIIVSSALSTGNPFIEVNINLKTKSVEVKSFSTVHSQIAHVLGRWNFVDVVEFVNLVSSATFLTGSIFEIWGR